RTPLRGLGTVPGSACRDANAPDPAAVRRPISASNAAEPAALSVLNRFLARPSAGPTASTAVGRARAAGQAGCRRRSPRAAGLACATAPPCCDTTAVPRDTEPARPAPPD